jgi:hypothetical protein
MKKIANILLAGVLLISLYACKKKDGDNDKLDPSKNASIEGYMSTKVGSWWLYSTSEGKILKRMATGTSKEKDGFVYDLYKMVDTTSVMQEETDDYFAKNENNYLSLVDLDGSQTNYIRAIIYRDGGKVGDQWTNTGEIKYNSITFDVMIESEIIGMNETKVINGVTFDSVCVTKNSLKGKQAILAPTWVKFGTIELWFRKGVGILKRDMDINILSFYTRDYEDEIIGYHLEP